MLLSIADIPDVDEDEEVDGPDDGGDDDDHRPVTIESRGFGGMRGRRSGQAGD